MKTGQYPVTCVIGDSINGSGTQGAALALGGTAPSYAQSAMSTANEDDRITLNAILSIATAQTLTVINPTDTSNTYCNSTLTVVKPA